MLRSFDVAQFQLACWKFGKKVWCGAPTAQISMNEWIIAHSSLLTSSHPSLTLGFIFLTHHTSPPKSNFIVIMSLTQRCHLLLVSVLILNLSSFLGFADGFSVDRRSVISIVGSTATGILFAPPEDALAITTETGKSKPEVYDYIIDDFTVSIPSNWKVTSKPPVDSNTNKSKRGQNPKLFSAIDFQSGGVITVVREQACNAQEYAQSINSCNIVLPSDNLIFSENTIDKDIS